MFRLLLQSLHWLLRLTAACSLLVSASGAVLWIVAQRHDAQFGSENIFLNGGVVHDDTNECGWTFKGVYTVRFERHILFGQRYEAWDHLEGEQTQANRYDAGNYLRWLTENKSADKWSVQEFMFLTSYPKMLEIQYYPSPPMGISHGYVREAVVTVPFQLLVLPTAVLPAAIFASYVRRRLHNRILNRRGLCVFCEYDLRGSPDRCPECGAVPTGKLESDRKDTQSSP
jgi:hypothetical protein